MSDTTTVRFDEDQLSALKEMQEIGEADNYSEAVRIASTTGLHALGYLNGGARDTRLRALFRRFGDAFGLLGLMWIGVSFWLPIEFRVWAAGPWAAWAACHVADRLLARYEPAVSRRFGVLESRDPVATDGGDRG